MAITPDPVAAEAGAPALESFADVSAAVESGAGLPAVARATSKALDASVAVLDAESNVLAVACASPEDERRLLSRRQGTEVLALRVADRAVGELLLRPRGASPPPALPRMVGALIGLEVERSRGPERAAAAAVGAFLEDLLARRATDRANIVARARELGTDLAGGGSVIVVRARPSQPETGDWRARVLAVAERSARAAADVPLAGVVELSLGRVPGGQRPGTRAHGTTASELLLIVPAAELEGARRAAAAVLHELEARFAHHRLAVARSRPAPDPVDLHRAAAEAVLAANVAEVQGSTLLAFEETGAYRLLLPAMSEDPSELQRFHHDTVAPIAAYDEQYETELVRTLEVFLDEDASVAKTAQRIYTHRHTIRYRLDRVRELTGLDPTLSEDRERLGLGLKALRIIAPRLPR